MIRFNAVSKFYNGVAALSALDLDVEPGKTTVLIGPSGCGKSTALRLIVGLVAPDAGRVTFEGKNVDKTTLPAIRQKTGYVIQEGGLFPHLTAAENINLMALHLGWGHQACESRLRKLAALTHLPEDKLARYPLELSGGQRQRVALMRALMLDPDVLLLDEPLGALDPMIRAELQAELRSICRALGKTVIMVTHDMNEAAYFGDTIVLMRAGKLVQCGAIDALLQRPADPFVTDFIRAQRSALPPETG